MLLKDFAFLVTLLASVFNPEHAESRKLFGDDFFPSPTGCTNCSLCQYPCHPLAPPPPSGYPVYGVPPPPPIYGTPPQVNCTQFPSQCCFTNPPPYPFGGYQPVVDNYSASCSPFYFMSVMLLAIYVSVLL